MTREDCAKLIALVTVSFPSYLKGLSPAEKQGAVSLWMEFVGEYDSELGYHRVKELLHSVESLYQSDNIPLMVEKICKRIKGAVKAEFPTATFASKETSRYVEEARKKRGKWVKADYRALPPRWDPRSEDRYMDAMDVAIEQRIARGEYDDNTR